MVILETLIEVGKPYTIQLYPTGNHDLTDLETGERINYTPEMMGWVFGVLEEAAIKMTATP